MKIYYPQDSEGNTIGFKTHESCIFDETGEKLSSKLEKINSKINKSISAPDGLSYNDTTLSLDKGASVVSSVNIGKVSDTVSFDENTNILSLKRGNETISFTEITVNGGTGVPVGPCTSISATPGNGSITIKWTDPSDVIVGETTIATWSGTKLLYKAGSYPENVNDGILVVDSKVRNQYSSTGYTINELTNGETYYFRLFPYSEGHNYNMDAENEISSTPVKPPIIYGFYVDEEESDPSARVHYISGCDNENFRPAHMDFTNDAFDYGDWEDAFFMPKPCMLKYNGTVDYYLDPNDYTKRYDGTNSDVANTAYGGNAMIQWPKMYFKRYKDGSRRYVYISDTKVDNDYKCYSHHDANGNEIPFCYTPIYTGSNVSGILRSLSGQGTTTNVSGTVEIQRAQQNNTAGGVTDIWYTEVWSDRNMVNDLLVLIGRSTNTQETFGYGVCTTSAVTKSNGTMNNRGLFWGRNDRTSGVKVFGMENWWGNIRRRTAGLATNDFHQIVVKSTWGKEDGSTVVGYRSDGYGYVSAGIPSISSGYIKTMTETEHGSVPLTTDGSDSTYECDYFHYYTNNGNLCAICGGFWDNAALGVGAFLVLLYNPASFTDSYLGAALSCKPKSA